MVGYLKTARGLAKPATPEEIAKEDSKYYIASDIELILTTDTGDLIAPNTGDFGFTHPNLHRRIEDDVTVPEGVSYPLLYLDPNGVPYKQTIKIGVWDGINSYRTTDTHTHDEESTTCEIP